MRYEDERYVRIYTRDTPEWLSLPWSTRALFWEVLRHVDRAGLLPLGRDPARALAGLLRCPVEVADEALRGWIEHGSATLVTKRDDPSRAVLFVPNFVTAQESTASDAARKRASRERAAAEALAAAVTNRDGWSQIVTDGHENAHSGHAGSRLVTRGHSVPNHAVPTRTDPPVVPHGGTDPVQAALDALVPVPDLTQRVIDESEALSRENRSAVALAEGLLAHDVAPGATTGGGGATTPAPAPRSPARRAARKPRPVDPAVELVRAQIAALVGVEYPPAAFDALRARLAEGERAEAMLGPLRSLSRDPFWGGQVKLDPTVIFRPSKWPSLSAKASATPRPAAGRAPLPEHPPLPGGRVEQRRCDGCGEYRLCRMGEDEWVPVEPHACRAAAP